MSPDPRFDMPGILRALRAEARDVERERVRRLLEDAEADNLRRARESGSRKPESTGHGRRATGMREALELLESAGRTSYAGDHAGGIYAVMNAACDSVELYQYDPTEEVEEMPVRVVVVDGADNTMASAYLNLDEAEQIFTDGLALVEQIRRRRAERASPSDGEP
jgi:hypothetical protein